MPQYPAQVMPSHPHLSSAITTNTGTQVKTTGGTLMGVIVNTAGTSWTATLYDGTSSSGTLLGTVSLNAVGPISFPGLGFKTGLFVQPAGTTPGSFTVAYF